MEKTPKKLRPWMAVAAGAVAGGIYQIVRGKGIFNKPRFAEQHRAVERYLESHYPGATYSNIQESGNGWSCVVRTGTRRFILYLTRTREQVYIFHESDV